MKKTLLLAAALFAAATASAQIKGQEMEQYRRSSLNMIMIEDPELDPSVAATVKDAFVNNPIPAKYNDHGTDASLRTFSIGSVTVTDQDRAEYQELSGKAAKSGDGGAKAKGIMGLAGALTGIEIGPSNPAYQNIPLDSMKRYIPYVAYKYLKDKKIAKLAVDKWFGVESGALNTNLIEERAFFNATEQELINAAEQSDRDAKSAIMDNGGHEIVGNTFITVSRFRYMNAEQMGAEIIKNAAMAAQFMPQPAADAAMSAAELSATATMLAMGDGYVIYTTTYLYRLVWNEEIFALINDASSSLDKYNALDCFSLEFVGSESASASVAAKKRTPEEAVRFATSRSLDKVLAKLEKKYEVFRTKTPLLTVTPEITAGIGAKECVEKGDNYEVLAKEVKFDKKLGQTVIAYKRIGKLKVKTVGNNMGEDNDEEEVSDSPVTVFEGKLPGKVTPGTLIRQM